MDIKLINIAFQIISWKIKKRIVQNVETKRRWHFQNLKTTNNYPTIPPGFQKKVEISLAWRTVFWIFGVIFVFLTITFAILDFLDDFASKHSKSLRSERLDLENKVNKKRTLRFQKDK